MNPPIWRAVQLLLCMLGDTQRASHSVQIQFPFNRLCSHTGLHVPDPVQQKWQWVRRDGAVSRCWKESKIAVGHSWLFVRPSVRRHTRPFRFQFSFALSPSVFLFDDTNACRSHTSVHPSIHPSVHRQIMAIGSTRVCFHDLYDTSSIRG